VTSLWTAYPIVFGLTEGANRLSVDTEIIAYGVLDVWVHDVWHANPTMADARWRSAAKVGFTFLLLIIHTHGEDDTWIMPEWFTAPRTGSGPEGRGGYGAINSEEWAGQPE